jgi:chemotaxis protein MotB
MALLNRRAASRLDIWPGFVDALASLLMVLIFVLLAFVLTQFFLSETLSGREAALRQLQGQVSELAAVLALERKAKDALGEDVARLTDELRVSLSARQQLEGQLRSVTSRAEAAESQAGTQAQDLVRLGNDLAALQALKAELEREAARLSRRSEQAEAGLIEERKLSESARAQLALLNQQTAALREQIAQLAAALDASEKKAAEQQVQITALGQRLNAALAGKVQELAHYRSEFFGRLREVLGDNPEIRIVGDRFVFASEVLFAVGSADLGDPGRNQITRVADALKQIAAKIPPDIDWILQVEGHTDRVPISTAQFRSNWELSQARAMSVLRLLVESGIPARRLSAAGYAEYQPIEPGEGEAAYSRNRRIELKLTQR